MKPTVGHVFESDVFYTGLKSILTGKLHSETSLTNRWILSVVVKDWNNNSGREFDSLSCHAFYKKPKECLPRKTLHTAKYKQRNKKGKKMKENV